ncbi:glycine--tRNA ligase subunit beta [Acidihalobacter yilgarnensis]|uniref:Glycine--tRNA ligase beta subunit n=1 Tax=Acidihalobacter yilgarnensis TaxID=2819280 RepID=A0A1D8IS86_9GAMM|nr:glycine--tRNA ligase subunit beta [Acidihalobacter yilgarnensis]AOU99255.1 glycine--tRNA ligase subunit beta [Acidihalobacter yilgarnensis]
MNESRADLLIEIGTEELPPGSLRRLAETLADELATRLEAAGVCGGVRHVYATPRRLAVRFEQVPLMQPDRRIERRGPALTAAFDAEGQATKAAQGFARSVGLEVDALERLETDKGTWLCAYLHEPGRATAALIPEMLTAALGKLPIAKRMRWGASEAEFVRPVHWIVLLLGETVIETEILGVKSGRMTHGHRAHHPEPLCLADPAAYAPLLETQGHVLPDFDARRAAIKAQIEALAAGLGGRAMLDEALLDEVTALVEWPVAVAGGFEARFLEVPHEALITTMMDNQRYFPVLDADGRLMPHFITIANLESRDPAQVRAGNERVIRPRLHDAEFFWQQDRRQPLVTRREALKGMVFQSKLGTLYDRSDRMARLAGTIAGELGAAPEEGVRAGELAKCDLVTAMVFEFPELQGVMGRYYATHDGEPAGVARAIEDQYRPAHAGDRLPDAPVAQALALADKLDTLVGIFAIGQRPSGTKDPFALRRAALGVVRILIEGGLELDLEVLLGQAAEALASRLDAGAAVSEVFDYVMERLTAYYADRGIPSDVVDAVLACRPTRLTDLDRRVQAVQAFRALPEAEALAAANKRIRNILRQNGSATALEVERDLLVESAERDLFEALLVAEAATAPQFQQGHYGAALTHLAALRAPVDRFFDETLVMAEDEALRRNRVGVLARLSELFLRVADISRLQTVG